MGVRVAQLGEVPVLAGLGNGIGHVGAGRSKEHYFVGTRVHHIEEGLYAHGSIALEKGGNKVALSSKLSSETGIYFRCYSLILRSIYKK